MNNGKKVAMICLLSAGVFVMIAAILRVAFVLKVGHATNTQSFRASSQLKIPTADISFSQSSDPATPAIWACRETLVAMCAVNAPLLLPLFNADFWNKGLFGRYLTVILDAIEKRLDKFNREMNVWRR